MKQLQLSVELQQVQPSAYEFEVHSLNSTEENPTNICFGFFKIIKLKENQHVGFFAIIKRNSS